MKPDIVFFGEGLSDEFHSAMAKDKDMCDLLIVMGSSLKVRPVALIPSSIDSSVPQILINREPLNHLNFDVELLGDCDHIVQEICNRCALEADGFCQHQSYSCVSSLPQLDSATLGRASVSLPNCCGRSTKFRHSRSRTKSTTTTASDRR